MSDLKDPLAAVKATMIKADNWFVKTVKAIGLAIWFVLVNLWAVVTTEGKTIRDWNLDYLKIFALALFGVAIWLVFVTVGLASGPKPDATIVSIVAGLVVTVGGYGTFLFNQAKNNDIDIRKGWRNQGNGS